MDNMIERLETIEKRYNELTQVLMDPDIGNDIARMTEASKEQASLQAAYDLYQEYKHLESEIEANKELLDEIDDEDIIEMAKMEIDELNIHFEEITSKLHVELIPKDHQRCEPVS